MLKHLRIRMKSKEGTSLEKNVYTEIATLQDGVEDPTIMKICLKCSFLESNTIWFSPSILVPLKLCVSFWNIPAQLFQYFMIISFVNSVWYYLMHE